MKNIGINLLYSVTGTGLGVYTRKLIEGLSAIDFENRYYIFANSSSSIEPHNANFKIIHYSIPENLKVKKLFVENVIVPFSAVKKKIDIFHFTSFVISYLYPGKFISTINDIAFLKYPEILSKKRDYYYKFFLKNALKKARFIITISDSTKRDVLNYYNFPEDSIKTIYLSAGDEFKPASREEIGKVKEKYNLKERYILFVSTLEPRKNIVNLLKAFKLINEKDVQLLICGKKGWLYEDIYNEITESSLEESVIIEDSVPKDDLIQLYSGAEFFILPSLYEGFGLPVLEAMACGTPVITSGVSSLPEVGGDAALYVDPLNIEDIADKISQLLSDDTLKSEMREKGFEQVKKFSWEKCAKETLEVYNKVLED